MSPYRHSGYNIGFELECEACQLDNIPVKVFLRILTLVNVTFQYNTQHDYHRMAHH